jgi:hypothetical protein
MQLFATLDKANPDTGSIRGWNLAVVKHTTVQVTRLLLFQELLIIRLFLMYCARNDRVLIYVVYMYIYLITCKMQFVLADKRPNTADWVWRTTEPLSRQRERSTSVSPQLSNRNKDLVLSPRWVLYSKKDWPTEPSVVTLLWLSLWAPERQVTPHLWQLSKEHTGARFALGFPNPVRVWLHNNIMQGTSRSHSKSW